MANENTAEVLKPVSIFPSVSSFLNIDERPIDLIRLLVATGHPKFLISGYDYHHSSSEHQQAITDILGNEAGKNAFVLVDSGNYESYWFKDNWWSPRKYYKALKSFRFDLALSFDNPKDTKKAKTASTAAQLAGTSLKNLRAKVGTERAAPIVHGESWFLPAAVAQVATEHSPSLIAVPERELGRGVSERIETIKQIRAALNDAGVETMLHLLGTGNPYSILAYTSAGANSFDGLEWCKHSVETERAILFPEPFFDLFREEPCDAKDFRTSNLRAMLSFLNEWEIIIKSAIQGSSLSGLLAVYHPAQQEPV